MMLAAPWRPEMYVISEEGILFGLDAPTGKRTLRYDFPRQFPYACSLSADGETMACADMLHLFNANDPSKYYERGLLIHNL